MSDQSLPLHGPGWVGEDNCWHHGHEPIPEGAYRVCGECGHCFATEADLSQADFDVRHKAYLAGFTDSYPTVLRSGEQIYSCPLCTHDF